MKIVRGIKDFNQHQQFKNPVVAVGIFDGVHLGHKKILSRLVRKAKEIKGTSVVITLDPHPVKVLYSGGLVPLLISLEHRLRLIKESGVDIILLLKFTDFFSKLTAEDFIRKILVGKIGLRELFVGSDFVFGKNRKGSLSFLKNAGGKYGFKVTEVPMVKSLGSPISSTRIRNLIIKGKLPEASKLLGRPASILGTVKKGAKRGRILGYPTANIDPHHEAIPPSGVYAVRVRYKKRIFNGVLNIGRRPTFYPAVIRKGGIKYPEPTIETHIFGFNKHIYNEELEVEFVRKIRDEKRFPDKTSLVSQIRLDEKKAKRILNMR